MSIVLTPWAGEVTLRPVGERSALRLSASAYKTFTLCARKWAYEKVFGVRPPAGPNLALGTAVHASVESFIKHGKFTGVANVVGIAEAGRKHLEPLRERYLEPKVSAHVEARLSLPAGSYLGPLPFLGFVDYCDQRPGVVDHKTTKSLMGKWHHTEETITSDSQLLTYAGVLWKDDAPERVHVGHIYYQTEGARGTRALGGWASWGSIEHNLGNVAEMAHEMAKYAHVERPEDVPADTTACSAFGGCKHAPYCPVPKAVASFVNPLGDNDMSLDSILGNLIDSSDTATDAKGMISPGGASPEASVPAADVRPSILPPDTNGTDTPTEAQIAETVDGIQDAEVHCSAVEIVAWLEANRAHHHLPTEAFGRVLEAFNLGAPTSEAAAPTTEAPAPTTVPEKFAELYAWLGARGGRAPLKDAKPLIKAAVGLTKWTKRCMQYLGDGHDAGLWDYSASEVWLLGESVEVTTTPDTSVAIEIDTNPLVHVLVGCQAFKADGVLHIDEWIATANAKVSRKSGVPDYTLVDFAKGPAQVLAEIVANPPAHPRYLWVPRAHPMEKFAHRLIPGAVIIS